MEIKIVTEDRVGLLRDISAVFSRSRLNIFEVNTKENGKFPIVKIICSALSEDKAKKFLVKLKKLREIRELDHRLL